jgi:hypothetical protein
LDHWSLRQPSLLQDNLNDVSFVGDTFIGLSDSGRIISSPDGTNWVVNTSGAKGPLVDVAFGNGRFVAVGSDYSPAAGAQISVSSDSRNWVGTNRSALPAFRGIIFGQNTFLTLGYVGTNDFIWASPDGQEWSQQSIPGVYGIGSIGYAAGHFLAAGGYAIGRLPTWEPHAQAFGSGDGVNWKTLISEPGFIFGPMAVGEDRFLVFVILGGPARGMMLRPLTDGTWQIETAQSPGIGITTAGYGASAFVVLDGTAFSSRSLDGVNWTAPARLTGLTTEETGPPLKSIAFGRGTWVGVGPTGLIATSRDAINWSFGERATSLPLTSLCEGQGLIVAVGGETNNVGLRPSACAVLTSRDGKIWTKQIAPTDQKLQSVTFNAGKFVAVGGDLQKNSGVLLVSGDGTNWNRSSFDPLMPLSRVVYGNGLFAAVGDSGSFPYSSTSKTVLISSADGTNWTTRLAGDGQLYFDLTYGSGRFVLSAVGPDVWHVLYSSTNLINWDGPFPAAGDIGSGLSFGNGFFRVAGRGPGVETQGVHVSSDGVHWTFMPTPEQQPEEVIAVPGRFVGLANGTTIMSSLDGMHWEAREIGSQLPLKGLGYAGRKVFAVGAGGTIFESDSVSPSFLSPPVFGASEVELLVASQPGDSVTVEYSFDLKSWSILATATNLTSTVLFSTPAPASSKQIFYRTKANAP